MDYTYIEQLMERYWSAETSDQEEKILRLFFLQDNVPSHLARYKSLFEYESSQKEVVLDADFDERMIALINGPSTCRPVTAFRISWTERLQPLYQSAAAIAVAVLVGMAAQHSFRNDRGVVWDYNPANFHDTYENPQQAYTVLENGLEMFQRTASADTILDGGVRRRMP